MADLSLLQEINEHQRKIEAMSIDVESINRNINAFKVQINEIVQSLGALGEFFSFKDKIERTIQALYNEQILIFSKLSDHKSDIENIRNLGNDLHEAIYKTKSQAEYVNESFQLHAEEQKLLRTELKERTEKTLAVFQAEMNKKLSEFAIQLAALPASITESNQEVLKRVDIAAMDGTNAMIKVNNTDISIRMLERRLENLSLQVKKNELTAANQ